MTPAAARLTVGLGLIDQLAVVPQLGDEHVDAHGQKLERTVALAPAGLAVVGIPLRSALIRSAEGTWSYEGAAEPAVFLDGRRMDGLEALSA